MIAYMRAAFIEQVMQDSDRAIAALKSLQAEMPDTEAAQQAQARIDFIVDRVKKEAALANLVGNPAPELNFTWATRDGLSNLEDLRGKVVILDFWATWCGPCVRSFPQMRELANHYADSPVEIVGVTSLQGQVHGLEPTPIETKNNPDREHALMGDYVAKQQINWTIAFSEQEVFNPDYGITGIPHVAILAPDGTLRYRGLHPMMPKDEKHAMIDGLLEEFGLPLPEQG